MDIYVLQVLPNKFWIVMSFPCIEPTWNVCRDFSPHCMIAGENYAYFYCLYPHMIFLTTFNCFCLCSFQILGNAGPSLQQEFYNIEGLAQEIAGSVFVGLDHLPDHRLRLMIHILLCLFHFIFGCPPPPIEMLSSMDWRCICIEYLGFIWIDLYWFYYAWTDELLPNVNWNVL